MILIKFKNTLYKYNNIFHIIYLFDIKIQKILILTEKKRCSSKNIAIKILGIIARIRLNVKIRVITPNS